MAKTIVKQEHIDAAMEKEKKNQLGFFDIQLSPLSYLTFGTYGLSLTTACGPLYTKKKTKWVMDWKSKSVQKINEELADQPWEVE